MSIKDIVENQGTFQATRTEATPRRASMISKRNIVRMLGFGTLLASGMTVIVSLVVAVVLIGPLLFWFAWNVLDLGESVGLGELGFWAIVLATYQ